ncbi:MAG: hypothetical protein ACK5V3_00545 [Bdellovibrionales bacterium]
MKTILAILLISAFSYANPGRPNFVCQTNPNAAGMKIKALVYTFYYSGDVRVDLFHSSTFRDELIVSETSKPKTRTKNEIKYYGEAKASVGPSTDDDMFIPLPSIPGNSLHYDLKFKQGNQWTGDFTYFQSGNTFTGKPSSQKNYKMGCLKM